MFAMGPAFFKSASGGYATLTVAGTFAAATVGTAYSSSIPITGGLEPYSLTGGTGVVSGSLDTGFALSITGTTGARLLTLACTSPAAADTMGFTASVGSADGQTATSAQSVVVGSAVKWDASHMGLNLTLSNSDLTVTRGTGGGSAYSTVRATQGRNSGKRVFQVNNDVITANNDGLFVGLVTASTPLDTFCGYTADSYGVHSINGRFYNNFVVTGGYVPPDSGQQFVNYQRRIAVDFDAGKIWVGLGSGWEGDPAAGTGAHITFPPGTTLYPAVTGYRSPQQMTGYFRVADLPGTPYGLPIGFSDW